MFFFFVDFVRLIISKKMIRVALLALTVLLLPTEARLVKLKERLAGYNGGSPSSSGYQSSTSQSSNPFAFPLSNGFPNINNPSQQLNNIETQAHGTLPNAPPPPTLAPDDLTSLRLIAFNELFEVAFFTSLLANITKNVTGFTLESTTQRQKVLDALTAVQAQEELHALNANGALAHFNAGPIQPCRYTFPTTDFNSAITLAITFTDVVLGTLQDVIVLLGQNGDAALSRGIASVVGQEGEQNGFYRSLLGKIPSALPFLTAASRDFAFSALNQNFIVPGSCPNSNTINLHIFAALTVNTKNIQPVDQTLSFTFDASCVNGQVNGLSLVYINQQNIPIVEPILHPTTYGNKVTFNANFPFTENELNGLTIAAVVNGAGPFANVDAVANATIAGPGLIEVN